VRGASGDEDVVHHAAARIALTLGYAERGRPDEDLGGVAYCVDGMPRRAPMHSKQYPAGKPSRRIAAICVADVSACCESVVARCVSSLVRVREGSRCRDILLSATGRWGTPERPFRARDASATDDRRYRWLGIMLPVPDAVPNPRRSETA
jgi:hypothetical protein